MLYQFRVKGIGNLKIAPVVRGIVVPYQHLDFVGREVAVFDTTPVLEVAQVVFIFSRRQEIFINKLIPDGGQGPFGDIVHGAKLGGRREKERGGRREEGMGE